MVAWDRTDKWAVMAAIAAVATPAAVAAGGVAAAAVEAGGARAVSPRRLFSKAPPSIPALACWRWAIRGPREPAAAWVGPGAEARPGTMARTELRLRGSKEW